MASQPRDALGRFVALDPEESETLRQVRILTGERKSLSEISAILGISARQVSRYRTRLYGPRPVEPYPAEMRQKVKNLLEDGASYNEVARTFHLADDTVRRWFPGYGWTQEQAAEFRAMIRLSQAVLH